MNERADDRSISGGGRSVDRVMALLRHVGALDSRITLERSFKLIHGRLFEDRILLGIDRLGRAGPLDDEIVSTCEKIGMPDDLLSSFKRTLADANHVYFGAENNEAGLMLKAYLEFRDKIEVEIASAPVAGRSYVLFTGYKWDAQSPSRQAVTRYAWYPSLPPAGILRRLRVIIDPPKHAALYGIVQETIERVSASVPDGDFQYLEVTEEGNPRTSFDINVYKARRQVQEMHALLLRAVQHFAIAPAQFASLYGRINSERFGHLAGGVDRHGREFMTVYHGVTHADGRSLRSAALAQRRD